MDLPLTSIAAVFATFFLAGVVKGVTGMGLPTLAMGLLGSLISPLAAASLLIVPSFVTNVWQLLAGHRLGPLLRRLWPMMLPIVIGTLLGSTLLAGGDTGVSTSALGGALVLYSGYSLLARQMSVPRRFEPWLSPVVGASTGLVTGATGVFVIPAVPYLQSLGLSKDDLVQALGLSFTASTIALALGLGTHGALQFDSVLISFVAVIPAMLGMWSGQVVRRQISPETFRRWFLICLAALGTEMLSRPLL